jgi:protein ImuB
MSRIVSVWLRSWPIARLLRAQRCAASVDQIDPGRPLVLVAPGKGGPRVVSLNRAAQQGGLAVGELLSNARSKVEGLQSRNADPTADAAALDKLALWCLRYAPLVAASGEASGADGLFIDITGAGHLAGGEAELLDDLSRRLTAFGLFPRLAIADTAGAGWAVCRHGGKARAIVPPGAQESALRPLPLAALRLPEEALPLLRRLGLRRIGDLLGQPRAPLAARFDAAVLHRLDRALGFAPEPLASVLPPPVYAAQASFVEPIFSAEHVLVAARRLLENLHLQLAHAAAGARVLCLLLFRVDGEAFSLDLGLAAPTRDAEHILRLITLQLERLGEGLDAEFGIEAAALHVLVAEPLGDRQTHLVMERDAARPEALAQLIDRLQQRLGARSVSRLHPHQSHIPERAVRLASPILPPPGMGRAMRPRPAAVTADNASNSDRRAQTSDTSGGSDRQQVPAPNELPLEVLDLATRRRKQAALARRASLAKDAKPWGEGLSPRPLLLLPRPVTAEVVALIPEGPPRQFRWRGVLHQIVGAQGPERIAPEWWRRNPEETRDYYLVENATGRRFWLYRAGLYGRSATVPQWFVHGVWG